MSPTTIPPTASVDIGEVYLGIDVGGTNVKLGLVDAAGNLVAKHSTATKPLRTPQAVFQYARDYARDFVASGRHAIAAVGLAVPGVLDTRKWMLREVVNLPEWLGVSLRQMLIDVFGLPGSVVNDANAAAFAEHDLRGLGDQSLALLTLGTGVGCGVVVAGRPHSGDHGCAGELGHIAIDFSDSALPCTCGSRGHLEAYAGSAGVLARLKTAQASAGPRSDSARDWTPRDIASSAEAGDPICQRVIDQTAVYVGRAIGMMGQTVDPAVVLIGGAMTFGGDGTQTGRRFLAHVRETVVKTTLVQVGQNLHVEFASLGNDAGVMGAAMVAKRTFQEI